MVNLQATVTTPAAVAADSQVPITAPNGQRNGNAIRVSTMNHNNNGQFTTSLKHGKSNTEHESKLVNLKELQQQQSNNAEHTTANGADHQQEAMATVITASTNGSTTHAPVSAEDLEEVAGSGVCAEEDDEDNHCLLCNAPFNLLLNKRFVCKVCALNVCRNCSICDDPDWICKVCDQQRTISSQLNCQSWICKRIKSATDRELVHLVNAKLRLEADRRSGRSPLNGSLSNGFVSGSESTNGHSTTAEEVLIHQEAPFLELGPNQLEHLIALRSDVELIVMKLLGIESIDYAHVGLLFDDEQYSELVQFYTPTLASLLSALQESIYISQSGKEPSLSPTEAYAQLKDLLGDISEKSFLLTPLRPILRLDLDSFLRGCASYEHLLANSIVNQIVEVSQTRFLTTAITPALKSATSCSPSVSGHYSPISPTSGHSFGRVRSSCSGAYSNESAGTGSDIAPGLKALDDYSSYESLNRNGGSYTMNSCEDNNCDTAADFDDVDEVALEEVANEQEMDDSSSSGSDDSFDINLDFDPVRVNFPEAGVDLVDSRYSSVDSDLSQDSGIKVIDNSSTWQDNWLFKKHKENKSYHQYHLNSDIHYGYMALALSDPVPMLIPNPSQPFPPLIGESEVDDVSDLSEHNSETGSVEDLFSDLDDDIEEEIEGRLVAANVDDIDSGASNGPLSAKLLRAKPRQVNLSKEALAALAANAKWKRWAKIKVPDFVPSELRTICSSIPNSHQLANIEYVPSITLKPGNASVHSGIVTQFCCKATGLMPLYFAWYKDGQLIACSDDSRAADSSVAIEDNEETKQRQLARIYFGIRFTHRRTVEAAVSNAAYRLIVFNDNECILEVRKTSPLQAGTYSVVAYNHAGYDWADFAVAVDRAHYTASLAVPTLSPRPVRRRPQNKPRKSLVCTVIEQQQLSIINHLVKAVSNTQNALKAALPVPVPRPRSITPTTVSTSVPENLANPTMNEPKSAVQTPEPIPNFKQRTWKEREEEQLEQHGENGDEPDGDFSEKAIAVAQPEQTRRTSTSSGATLIYDSNHVADEVVASDSASNPDPLSLSENGEPIMEIADREHRKWLRPDVELVNNPYTAEGVEQRAKQLMELSSLEESGVTENGDENEDAEDEENGFEKKKFFSDRDITRYKRDYYLPKNRPLHEDSQVFSILNTLGGANDSGKSKSKKNSLVSNSNNDSNLNSDLDELDSLPEPNGHEVHESITSPPPLSFSDSSLASPTPSPVPEPSEPATPLVNGEHSTVILNGNGDSSIADHETVSHVKPLIIGTETKPSLTNGSSKLSSLESETDLPKNRPLKDQGIAKLPSVKNLVSLFSNSKEKDGKTSPLHASTVNKSSSANGRSSAPTAPIRNANNYKVHSLTARSMPREFREQTQKQIPRTTNRISLTNELLQNNRIVEQNESDQSIPNSTSESLTSDDNLSSNSSSLSNGTGKEIAAELHNQNGDHRYRPILQRAHYWQKRMEEGLVSDQKAKHPFPAMDGSKVQ